MRLFQDKLQGKEDKKKELKLNINCSVALLDKDYVKLVGLVKDLKDKEEQTRLQLIQQSKGQLSGLGQYNSGFNTERHAKINIKKGLARSHSQSLISKIFINKSKGISQNQMNKILSANDEDILESHDIKNLKFYQQEDVYEKQQNAKKEQRKHLLSLVNPSDIRYLNLNLQNSTQQQSHHVSNSQSVNDLKSQRGISEYIQKLLDSKKEKVRQLFSGYNTHKEQTNQQFKQKTKNRYGSVTERNNSSQLLMDFVPLIKANNEQEHLMGDISCIQEEAFDEDSQNQQQIYDLNFHYKADLQVGFDQMQFNKLPNTTRQTNDQNLSRNESGINILKDLISIQDPQIQSSNINKSTIKSLERKQSKLLQSNTTQNLTASHQIIPFSNSHLQLPFQHQEFVYKGKSQKALLNDKQMLESAIKPQFQSPNVDLKINNILCSLVQEINQFQLANKMKEDYMALFKQRFKLTESEQSLALQKLQLCQQLKQKEMISGLWEFVEISGQLPQTRESARVVSCANDIYLFGGSAAKEPFNDSRRLDDMDDRFYAKLFENTGEEGINFPKKRYGHSLSLWQRQLVVFGGGGAYNQQAKMRLTYNDVFIFDIDKQHWKQEQLHDINLKQKQEEPPKRRMHHAADVFGCILVVQGGISGEDKSILSDFALYDLKRQSWLYLQSQNKSSKKVQARYMHQMTAVYSENIDDSLKSTRAIWAQQFQPKDKQLLIEPQLNGLYIFGGLVQKQSDQIMKSFDELNVLNEEENKDQKWRKQPAKKTKSQQNEEFELSNELFLIKPDYQVNKQRLYFNKKLGKDLDYKIDNKYPVPSLAFEVVKLEPLGKPPLARCLHAQTFFAKRYLAVFGGRNDKMFQSHQNIALNDLCLYEISKNTWTTVVSFGCYPEGRFSHSMCQIQSGHKSFKLVIFGGMSQKEYCQSTLLTFNTNSKNQKLKLKIFKDRISDIDREVKRINNKLLL
eukprot:403341758